MSTVYDVFARKEHPEPLVYIGTVKANSPDDLTKISLETYGPDSKWLEMLAVPHREVIRVFPESGEDE